MDAGGLFGSALVYRADAGMGVRRKDEYRGNADNGYATESTVRHSNWDKPNLVSTGTFRFVSGSTTKVTYNGGTKQYTLRGFVYRP